MIEKLPLLSKDFTEMVLIKEVWIKLVGYLLTLQPIWFRSGEYLEKSE